MTNIALFTATDIEFRAAASLLEKPRSNGSFGVSGLCGENRIELFRTDMGPRNAATKAADALSQCKADTVLVGGLAGSLSTECGECDIALYRSCRFIENDKQTILTVDCDRVFTDRLRDRLLEARLPVREGAGLTMSRMLCKAEEKRSAGILYKAIAVDMESYQILRAAEESGAKAAVLRIISDDAKHDLPDFNWAIDEDAEPNNLKMLLTLGAHPVSAARFLFNLRRAVRRFKEALGGVLRSGGY